MPRSRSSSPPRAARRSSRTRRGWCSSPRTRTARRRASSATSTRWAVTPQGYDVSIGKPTRIEGTSWSYLESTSYTNARLEYVFFFDKEAAAGSDEPAHRAGVRGTAVGSAHAVLGGAAGSRRARVGAEGRADRRDDARRDRSAGTRRVWFYLPPGYAAGDGHALSGRLRARRRELRREDGRAARARSPDRQQVDPAGDRGVLGAGRSAGRVFAQPEVARVHRQRAGADGRQAVPHLPGARSSRHSRQLARRLRRRRSRRRIPVAVRALRGHCAAGADRHRSSRTNPRRARRWCRSSSSCWAASTIR